ncbi:PLP-dependent aminotransferase family protein [Roseateles sp.]|uniref:aminotransferase-like domain-containing protein n=1 Tax=Roseateles sp. TaxID=1971397 RepID=UPI003BAC36F1
MNNGQLQRRATQPAPLYERLAEEIEQAVADGALNAGDKLPSIRASSRARRVAVTTVRRAYSLLESRGVVGSRPQSGYFVRAAAPALTVAAPEAAASPPPCCEADISQLVLATLKAIHRRQAAPLGSPYPDPALFPWARIQRHAHRIGQRFPAWNAMDDLPPGHPALIQQIARRHLGQGLAVDPADVVVTAGATEAIQLCLQAVTRPGDTVAVESPTYYATLMTIERLGLRAVEVPTHPVDGMDLAALARLLDSQRVAACVTMPNFQNPAGFTMPDAHKAELVRLAARHGVPVIENGVYNELYYGDTPPTTLKGHDDQGGVLHCASFSKSVTAGVRVGWVLPGRYRQQLERLKFRHMPATPAVPQLALAEYLGRDGMDLHLRGVRKALAQRADMLRALVLRCFPAGTHVSRPQGGYLLWVELAQHVDTLRVYRAALERGITIAPGRIFSNAGRYTNFMRLNHSYAWTPALEAAVRELGRIVAWA